jgi:hypothetical protein
VLILTVGFLHNKGCDRISNFGQQALCNGGAEVRIFNNKTKFDGIAKVKRQKHEYSTFAKR